MSFVAIQREHITREKLIVLNEERPISHLSHEFVPDSLTKVKFSNACSLCRRQIVNSYELERGVSCSKCGLNLHQKCCMSYQDKCVPNTELNYSRLRVNYKSNTQVSASGQVDQGCVDLSSKKLQTLNSRYSQHRFVTIDYSTRSSRCIFCSLTLFKHGMKVKHCRTCDIFVHDNCIKNVPNTCGLELRSRNGLILLVFEECDKKSSHRESVKVHIKKCHDLKIMDSTSKSDPYVKYAISREGEIIDNIGETEVIKDELNPVFNHKFEVKSSDFGKGCDRLYIYVKDYDTYGNNDFIGGLSFSRDDLFCGDLDLLGGTYALEDREKGMTYNRKLKCLPLKPQKKQKTQSAEGTSVMACASTSYAQSSGETRVDFKHDLRHLKYVREGTFGSIYQARMSLRTSSSSTQGGEEQDVYVKLVEKSRVESWKTVECMRNEVQIGKRVRTCSRYSSKTEAPFYTVCAAMQTEGHFVMLTPKIEYSTSKRVAVALRNDRDLMASFTKQCLSALVQLRELRIIHRNIKEESIVINNEGQVKLTDFAVSKLFDEANDANSCTCVSVVGTPSYMSPEIHSNKIYSFETDLYSLGVTLSQLYTGSNYVKDLLVCEENFETKFQKRYSAMRKLEVRDIMKKVLTGRLVLPEYVSQQQSQLLTKLLTLDRKEREESYCRLEQFEMLQVESLRQFSRSEILERVQTLSYSHRSSRRSGRSCVVEEKEKKDDESSSSSSSSCSSSSSSSCSTSYSCSQDEEEECEPQQETTLESLEKLRMSVQRSSSKRVGLKIGGGSGSSRFAMQHISNFDMVYERVQT